MNRDFARLADGRFELLVIGGGVYGAWVAYDAALRGLRVALVEKTDWGAGTSSASSKLIHGGLRYLESFRFGLVRKSLLERDRLARLAPHRVRPLTFVLPVYTGDRVGPFRLRAGLGIYRCLAGRGGPTVPPRGLGADELLRRAGFLSRGGLRAGFVYGDCVTDDARFALELVDGAHAAGAVAVNHARVVRLLHAGKRVCGAEVEDRETGERVEIQADVTVNAAGPWSLGLSSRGVSRPVRSTRGVHLVMPPLPRPDAFLLTAHSDGRVFFLIPWYGRTLLGTTDTDFSGDPDGVGVEAEDVAYLLREAGRVLGEIGWTSDSIQGSFAGVRILLDRPGRSASDLSREWLLEEPEERLLMLVGGKYTSARADASVVVDRVLGLLGRSGPVCPTRERAFPWAPGSPFEEWKRDAVRAGREAGLDGETAESCALRFGSRVPRIHALLHATPSLAYRIHPDLPFCRAEIVHAVREEMARTLEDILRRRIPLSVLAPPRDLSLMATADLAGGLLGWSREKRAEEIASLAGAATLAGS